MSTRFQIDIKGAEFCAWRLQRHVLLFDDNKVKMARKPGKKRKENPVGCCCCVDNKRKMARKPGKKQKENQVGCIGEGKI